MTKLYLIRHGETTLNRLGRMQGQIDSFLTEKGHYQAKQTASSLKAIKFSAIFSSDLGRAKQTTQDIINELQLANLPYRTSSDLREVNFGFFDGLPCRAVWQEITNMTMYDGQDDIIKHGGMSEVRSLMLKKDKYKYAESYQSIIERWQHFVDGLSSLKTTANILIVSHGTFIRTISEHYGAYVAGKENVPQNGGVTIFNMQQGRITLQKYNVQLE
ncbi:histidine phosphatase family protein [uncultured Limosilactobacillus sp.]|uniref:histidine phosphatase family protein n=1 Tax=uncultured Limosilactobacillus sp. TaxID=2837629 RepID=UPI0025E0D549|nr:histidine phosphatase family protein [uncultured Limosilactobacillus sp.]